MHICFTFSIEMYVSLHVNTFKVHWFLLTLLWFCFYFFSSSFSSSVATLRQVAIVYATCGNCIRQIITLQVQIYVFMIISFFFFVFKVDFLWKKYYLNVNMYICVSLAKSLASCKTSHCLIHMLFFLFFVNFILILLWFCYAFKFFFWDEIYVKIANQALFFFFKYYFFELFWVYKKKNFNIYM